MNKMRNLISKIDDLTKAKIYTALTIAFIISVYVEAYQRSKGGVWGIGLLQEIFNNGILISATCVSVFFLSIGVFYVLYCMLFDDLKGK